MGHGFAVVTSLLFFFFKQKTAYEVRISDWSSDVCSSDLLDHASTDLSWITPREPAHQLELDREYRAFVIGDRSLPVADRALERSDERRVGKACVRTCSSRWSPDH